MQAKILRALEERRFERVGGTSSLHVDVRVVAATNRNLRAAVASRRFREDLFFRLSVFPITIPPLRDRGDDVLRIAQHFVERFCRDMKKTAMALSPEAVSAIRAYRWPGNVRELQNCIERAVILAEGGAIDARHLNLSFVDTLAAPQETDPWERIDLSGTLIQASRRVLGQAERRKIEQTLREAGGNKPAASEMLQIPYKQLLAKMKEHGIE
jgi:transcriptional regulator with GAF, ATPase, and Fis domain